MRFIFLVWIGIVAVVWDFYARRIPNPLIMTGLILGISWQWSVNGPPGVVQFFAGALLPVALLAVLHYFRMLGAGDLKYYMVLGGFLGPLAVLRCIWISFLIAAVFSVAVLIKHHILKQRLLKLMDYLKNYYSTGRWEPYIDDMENAAYLHFSLPIFLGSLLIAGGMI